MQWGQVSKPVLFHSPKTQAFSLSGGNVICTGTQANSNSFYLPGQFHLVPKISEEGINHHIIPEDPPSDQNELAEKIKLLSTLLEKYNQSLDHILKEPTPQDPQVVEASSSTPRRKNKKPRKITIKGQDVETLNKGNWANDKVLMAILHHISRKKPTVLALDTFIFSNISENKSTHRLMKGIDLFEDNLTEVFIPCNHSSHWILGIFRPQVNSLEMICSLHYMATCERIGRKLASWIQQQAILQKVELGGEIEVSVRGDCPLQTDGYSCGLYMVHYADCIANKRKPVVHNINNIRRYWQMKVKRYLKEEEPEDVKGKEEDVIMLD